jgi:hypothetical protein
MIDFPSSEGCRSSSYVWLASVLVIFSIRAVFAHRRDVMETNFDASRTQGSSEEENLSNSELSAGRDFDISLFDQLWRSFFNDASGNEWRQEVVELSNDERQEEARKLFDKMILELSESDDLILERPDSCTSGPKFGAPAVMQYFIKFDHQYSYIRGEIALLEHLGEEEESLGQTDVLLKTVLCMERFEDNLEDGARFDDLKRHVDLIDRVRTFALKEGWKCYTAEADGYLRQYVGLCFRLENAAPHQIRDAVELFERATEEP